MLQRGPAESAQTAPPPPPLMASPHTAVRRTSAGTDTRSRPAPRGTGRRSGTAGWRTRSSGFHSGRRRSPAGTGTDDPPSEHRRNVREDGTSRRNRVGSVRTWQVPPFWH